MARTALGATAICSTALAACGTGTSSTAATTKSRSGASTRLAASPRPNSAVPPVLTLAARRRLAAPVQLPAATVVGSDVLLAGGLSAADTSLDTVTVVSPGAVTTGRPLPQAIHDAAAATVNGQAFVFGGGEPSHDEIRAIGPGAASGPAGRLPVPASDVAAAAFGGAAYVVGGYDGTNALPTIVRFTGHGRATPAGRLPAPLRYAAVTAADGRLIIVGGSVSGTASREVDAFDPTHGTVRHLGTLPHPLTHAAAVTLGRWVYVIGGRGTDQGTQSDAITALDPASGRVSPAGHLPGPLSDIAAAVVKGHVLVAGGRSRSGAVSDAVLTLTPHTAP